MPYYCLLVDPERVCLALSESQKQLNTMRRKLMNTTVVPLPEASAHQVRALEAGNQSAVPTLVGRTWVAGPPLFRFIKMRLTAQKLAMALDCIAESVARLTCKDDGLLFLSSGDLALYVADPECFVRAFVAARGTTVDAARAQLEFERQTLINNYALAKQFEAYYTDRLIELPDTEQAIHHWYRQVWATVNSDWLEGQL